MAPESMTEVDKAAAHCLKLPGKNLNLTALLYSKKFRAYGYKTGAQAAFEKLSQDGIGVVNLSNDDKEVKKVHVYS